MRGATLLRGAVLCLTVAAATAAALLMTWRPFVGALVALGLSVLGLAIDGLMYIRGATCFWPKLLDSVLALLWSIFVVLLLVTKVDWLRLYAGIIILAVLCLISCVSVLIGLPWVLQHAVDNVGPELWRPGILEGSARQEVFRKACAVVTCYWAFLFALMVTGVSVNVFCNTTLAEDGETLMHANGWVNLLLGGVWNVLLILVGVATSKKLGAYATMQLLARYEHIHVP